MDAIELKSTLNRLKGVLILFITVAYTKLSNVDLRPSGLLTFYRQ